MVPTVTAVTPPNGVMNIGNNAIIRVAFSKPINPLSVSGTTIQVSGGAVTLMPASISFDTTNMQVTFTPLQPLPDATLMTIAVNGVEDPAGNAVTPLTTQFTTGTGADTDAPFVTATNVFSGQTNVPVNTVFTITFNEPMDPQSINRSSIALYDTTTGTLVPGPVSLSVDGRTAMFAPSVALAVNRVYYLYTAWSLTPRDLEGNLLTNFTISFTTSTVSDTTPPQVVVTNPPDGTVGAPRNVVVQVLFDKPIDATSVNQVQLNVGSSPLAVTRTLSNGNRTLTLTPSTPLAANTSHTLSITGVRDTSGNLIVGTTNAIFTTGPGVELTGPSLTGFSPANGSVNVPVTTTAQITFSKPINTLSAFNGNAVLRRTSTGVTVATTISFSADFQTVTLTPTAPLTAAAQYTIAVTFSITDRAGNTITNATSANFTTQ